jgi:hypothetical protein
MEYILKILNIVFLASIKYFWTPPYALVLHLGVWETLLALEIGGICGYLFFFYLSHLVLAWLSKLWTKLYFFTPVKFKVSVEEWRAQLREKRKKRKRFTRMNKLIVKIRKRYGMWGIIILTPVLLSIPVGAILGNKYYSDRKTFLPSMILSIFLWGILSVLIFYVFPEVF